RDQVLGLHAMHARRRRIAAHLSDRTREAEHQVEGVNTLRDQHATAVTCLGAAALHIVIALWPPQPDHGRAVHDVAERALTDHLPQLQCGWAKTMLQHHTERDADLARRLDELNCALG